MPRNGMPITQRDPMQEQLSENIEALLQKSEPGDIIHLTDYIDLNWDKLCIFDEATSYENINKVLGFTWIPKDGYIFSSQYLVFVDENVVTMHLPLAANHFFTKNNSAGKCIPRKDAVFTIESVKLATGNGIRKYFSLQE